MQVLKDAIYRTQAGRYEDTEQDVETDPLEQMRNMLEFQTGFRGGDGTILQRQAAFVEARRQGLSERGEAIDPALLLDREARIAQIKALWKEDGRGGVSHERVGDPAIWEVQAEEKEAAKRDRVKNEEEFRSFIKQHVGMTAEIMGHLKRQGEVMGVFLEAVHTLNKNQLALAGDIRRLALTAPEAPTAQETSDGTWDL